MGIVARIDSLQLGVCMLTFSPRERRYLLCGSDGGDDPLHE